MNWKKYLKRMKYKGKLCPNLETLKKIQKLHLLNVPFENIDIIHHKKLVLDTRYLYEKIVLHHRGGICYELNGLLYELLKHIGFDVTLISADVLGNEYDHLFILAKVNNNKYLVDVGFGNHFLEPLPFILDKKQVDSNGIFRIIKKNKNYQLLKETNEKIEVCYQFNLYKKKLKDCEERCRYFETSKDSIFTKQILCSLERENGRISLTDKKLIQTIEDNKKIHLIENKSDFYILLKKFFNIEV